MALAESQKNDLQISDFPDLYLNKLLKNMQNIPQNEFVEFAILSEQVK